MDENTPYFDALGRFLSMYASAEAAAQMLLWHTSRVDLDTARVIWPSLRIKQITDMLRKLHRERREPIPKLLNEALSHLVSITSIRDDAVHYPINSDERGNRFAGNLHQQFHLTEPTKTVISIPLLHMLTVDLNVVVQRFIEHLPPSNPEHQAAWEKAIQGARTPLLYKPPQPEKKSRARG